MFESLRDYNLQMCDKVDEMITGIDSHEKKLSDLRSKLAVLSSQRGDTKTKGSAGKKTQELEPEKVDLESEEL